MTVSRATVLEMARLARLDPGDDELERIVADLVRIIDYVEMLAGFETAPRDARPAAPLLRDDAVGDTLPRDDALANAPETMDGHLVVPAFLPDDTGPV
jgi:aspartyl-tRNA(Asn)/glutamyl-tRNA(Gln) amidotransferase subunit C